MLGVSIVFNRMMPPMITPLNPKAATPIKNRFFRIKKMMIKITMKTKKKKLLEEKMVLDLN
mgnify:CR=1 FL=1